MTAREQGNKEYGKVKEAFDNNMSIHCHCEMGVCDFCEDCGVCQLFREVMDAINKVEEAELCK